MYKNPVTIFKDICEYNYKSTGLVNLLITTQNLQKIDFICCTFVLFNFFQYVFGFSEAPNFVFQIAIATSFL
jgi:hypothetical protein